MIDRPFPGLATGVKMMVGSDVEDVFFGLGEDGHDLAAEPPGDIANVLLCLIGPVHHAHAEVGSGVRFQGIHEGAHPGLLDVSGVFAAGMNEGNIAQLPSVVGFAGSSGESSITDVIVAENAAVEIQSRIAVGFVIANRPNLPVKRGARDLGAVGCLLVIVCKGSSISKVRLSASFPSM